MPATFGETWRRVRLHCPLAPVHLAQDWVQRVYADICASRGWGWLRAEGSLRIAAARSLAVSVTLNSATVTSAGLFLAADTGRQFRVGTFPIYTATFVNANTLTLDRAYEGTTSLAASAQILDLYHTTPSDFGRFLLVADPVNQRQIPFWITEEEIARVDPLRTMSEAGPRALASYKVSAATGTPMYEYWPAPTAARGYPYLYLTRFTDLSEDSTFAGVFKERGDLLVTGALVQAARWPGLEDRRNPYFNLDLARDLQRQFETELKFLALRDDDQYQQSYSTIPWHTWAPWGLSADDTLLRATDADAESFFL